MHKGQLYAGIAPHAKAGQRRLQKASQITPAPAAWAGISSETSSISKSAIVCALLYPSTPRSSLLPNSEPGQYRGTFGHRNNPTRIQHVK